MKNYTFLKKVSIEKGIRTKHQKTTKMLRVAGILAAILMISCVLALFPQPAQASTLTTTITVGNGVGGIAITPNGQHVYSTNSNDGTVSVISTSSNTVEATITVGQTPKGVAITPNGQEVYVTNYYGNTVSVISTATNTVTTTITNLNWPEDVAVSPNGEFIYVKHTYDQNNVLFSVISTSTNTVTTTITLNGYPDFQGGNDGAIAVAPNGESIYVASNDWSRNLVSVINSSTNTVTETITLAGMTFMEEGGSSGVAVAPNGEILYATSSDWHIGNSISAINTTTNTITETISLSGDSFWGSGSLAVTPNGAYVYAANGGRSSSISVLSVASPSTYAITVTQSDNGQISPGTSTVNLGDTPIFTITPNSGYHIANITVNGEATTVTNPAGQEYQFSEVSDNGSITATFVNNAFTVIVTQGDYGTISPGNTTVNYGSDQEFTITPTTGYHLVAIKVNGTTVAPTSLYTVTNVTGPTTLTVEFAINTYTITVTQSDHGTIAPSTTTVVYGGSQVFTITPNAGYHIVSLTVDGSHVTARATYTFSYVENSHSIIASFAIDMLTATVTTTSETFPLEISGNVTAQQMSNVTITPYQSTTTTIVSFTVSGPSGTAGFGNITLPKTSIPYGTNPVVYIDNNQVLNQGYTQDADNYYVWYTTHFSTHEVTIQFTSTPSPTPTITPNPSTMSLNVPVIAAIILMGLVIFGLLVKRKSRQKPQVLS